VTTARRLLLFDIDGTLVLTGGAGKRAMDRAFAETFGVEDAFAGMAMGGRTDRFLVEQALARTGLPAAAADLDRFRAAYLAHLDVAIHEPGHGTKARLPGVAALLDAVEATRAVQAALLTGNYEGGARIKLRHFDLWHRFAWGAFGDDHADREALACAALAEARARGVRLERPGDAVVVGDTPFDIACARAAGARVIAVATGGHSLAELTALGPDLAVPDLQDVDGLLDAILD
jgi:phosphoglycolate phosphatase-like HAD superfamily hydrolase